MAGESYEGWSNRATWALMLYANNDYGAYQAKNEWMLRHGDGITADQAKGCFSDPWYKSALLRDRCEWSDINWSEIAEVLNIDRAELLA